MFAQAHPWLAHLHPNLQSQAHYQLDFTRPIRQTLNDFVQKYTQNDGQILCTGYGRKLNFVAQTDLPPNMAYESFIAQTGSVPTRDNLHDWFNACIWLTFPKSKALLNCYQADCIAKSGVGQTRGRVRDAITIFDENGAILVTSDRKIGTALQNFDWQNCLVAPRSHWQNPIKNQLDSIEMDESAVLYIFGHALLEQLQTPRKPLCAHCLVIMVGADFFGLDRWQQVCAIDGILANRLMIWLNQSEVSPRQLSPLPVLGVPYFWAENSQSDFYEDAFVFRQGRRHKKSELAKPSQKPIDEDD